MNKKMKSFYIRDETLLALVAVKDDRHNTSLIRIIEDLLCSNRKVREGTFDYLNEFLDGHHRIQHRAAMKIEGLKEAELAAELKEEEQRVRQQEAQEYIDSLKKVKR